MILKPPKGALVNRGHPFARGLVGCWLMNEGGGNTVADLSGNGNAGTFVNDTYFTSGDSGPAASFDGTNDYIQLPTSDVFGLTSAGTLISRIKTADDTNDQVIYSKWYDGSNRAYKLNIDMGVLNRLAFTYSTLGSDTVIVYSDGLILTNNRWHQIAVTFLATGNIVFYVDGISKGSSAATGSMYDNNMAPRIGIGWGGSNDYTGLISQMMLYNRALTASEIAQLYREPFCMFEVDL